MKTLNKSWMKFFATTGFLYVLAGLIIWVGVSPSRVTLDRLGILETWADYPVRFVGKKSTFDEKQFRYTKRYYQTLARMMPLYEKKGMVDEGVSLGRTFAMIGFCDHYLGQDREAIEYYKKALKVGHEEIWINYDLGIIYFKSGEYAQAISYLKKNFEFNEKKMYESMDRDYYQYWAPEESENYKKFAMGQYYKLTINSYKLSILAYDRMGNNKYARSLALLAIKSGIAQNNPFFLYYAGLSSQKPKISEEIMRLAIPPSLFYISLGQEKINIRKQ